MQSGAWTSDKQSAKIHRIIKFIKVSVIYNTFYQNMQKFQIEKSYETDKYEYAGQSTGEKTQECLTA
jgi:hypothetical protein